VIFASWFIGTADYSASVRWTLATILLVLWWGVAHAVRERVVRPLQTAANLLSALREEDFSIRARSPRRDDVLGELMREINALSQTLREQRLGALEASALLRTVMSEVDVAVFAFDETRHLQLVNRAGERLLARPGEQLLGRTAAQLGLEGLLEGEPDRTVQLNLPGSGGRWGIRRSSFRQEGRPHPLLVMTDLSRALRDEERQAWQRLVRVIGHELNNSLAPIKSIAGTMGTLLAKTPRPDDWETDLLSGLTIIGSRADALSRFMESYSRLARLPPPQPRLMEVAGWVRRVAGLETRLKVAVDPGPALTLEADVDQLEQLLINLIRNAADATLESRPGEAGRVRVSWLQQGDMLEVCVEDDGAGISNPANLFVPFFTTKPGGSGIGLVLCRQIAEAHGGSLSLENRKEAHGVSARLKLPLVQGTRSNG
jgi:nitrogen fixation/metabolism regulation signal transduction histidine kinase